MDDNSEYFIIEASMALKDADFVCFFQRIDKVTNSYQDKDRKVISSDKIDVIMTTDFKRAKRFKYVFEAETWLKKLMSSDCDYTKFKIPFSFSIVFCRNENKIVTWETKIANEEK